MARLARLSVAGQAHYVVQTTVHGQRLAQDETDSRELLDALQAAAVARGVLLWGYAVLPQALHLIVCPPDDTSLGAMMQALGRRYVAAFNRRHGRRGALWGGRFRAALVEPGDWLLSALCHVDQLGLAQGGACSAPHHQGLRRDPLLSEPAEIWALGNTPFERESAYRNLMAQGVDGGRAEVLARAVHGTWVAGSPAFVAEIEARTGRRASPRRPGRPPRSATTALGR
jgi:putative transposase